MGDSYTPMTMHASEIPLPKELTGHLTEVALGCQRMLQENPCHPQALVGITLVALASGQPEAAVKMARAAVAAAPRMVNTWVALGQALMAAGRYDEAERAYIHAISLDGANPLARMGLGELKLASGQPLEAMSEFELALKRQPSLAGAHMGLGNALAYQDRNQEALARYQQAIALCPRFPEAEFAVGFVLARMGKPKEAEAHYRRAVTQRPDFAVAWVNLGTLLREQGREVYAEAAYQRAVKLQPGLVSGWVNRAILERERHRPAEAEIYLRKAFAINPEKVETLITWCQFRAAERDRAGAWQWLRWALAREPENAEAVNMHGILLHKEGRFEEAVEIFKQAEVLGNHHAASNRGNSLLDLGRMEEALHAQELAFERDPTNPGALYNLSLTRLRLGDWRQGWPSYEARWRFREVHRTPTVFSQPRWQGEALHGRRILLHAEQGLGDTIQFCRYASMVAERSGKVILMVQPPVERLMQSLAVLKSGQACTVLPNTKQPDFDLECPLLSLPAIFATTVETVPWSGAYLFADQKLLAEKLVQFPYLSPRDLPCAQRRIGLAWAGNPRYKTDHLRSVNLATLLPLLRASGITWISLQKGPGAEQLASLPSDVVLMDGSSHDRDLAETAALIDTLDLVITTDTSIAHLAGAMAKPVWILLPHLADWRWMQQTEASPWYPTARLFRQCTPGDWKKVIERVIKQLSDFYVAQSRPLQTSQPDKPKKSDSQTSRLILA